MTAPGAPSSAAACRSVPSTLRRGGGPLHGAPAAAAGDGPLANELRVENLGHDDVGAPPDRRSVQLGGHGVHHLDHVLQPVGLRREVGAGAKG